MKRFVFSLLFLVYTTLVLAQNITSTAIQPPRLPFNTIKLKAGEFMQSAIPTDNHEPRGLSCIDSSLIDLTAICPMIYMPVCGCNGVTYNNQCEAVNYGGVTSWTEGECVSTGCINPLQIDSSMACILIYDPVCGCNGVTYGNQCEAYYYGGVTSWVPGECGATACQADFIFEQNGLTIDFTNISIGVYDSVLYDFADGTTSSENNPQHTFSNWGTYNVCLTIMGANCLDTYCYSIILEPLCDAYFTFTNTCDNAVTFTNYSEGDTINSWNFADGGVGVINDTSFIHTFPASGMYVVCLNISGLLCSKTYCDTVYAFNDLTLPGFTETYIGSPTLPVTVLFNAETLIDYPFTYLWDFGDGESGTEQFMSHTYTNNCNPTVCLYVDALACNRTTCKTLDLCTTGIQNILDSNFYISPNPFNDYVTFNWKDATKPVEIELLDVAGKLIFTESISEKNTFTMNTSSLPKGLYILKVQQRGSIIHKKLVK